MEVLYVLALELVAFFGFLCILLNVLLPVLAFVLRFVSIDVPREWRKWQLHRAQQHELRRLQRRVDVLTRWKQTVRMPSTPLDAAGEAGNDCAIQEEQETRRRQRISSAKKRHKVDEMLQQDADEERYPIDDSRSSSKKEVESTTRQHCHRLSINSTGKKPAANGGRKQLRSRWGLLT